MSFAFIFCGEFCLVCDFTPSVCLHIYIVHDVISQSTMGYNFGARGVLWVHIQNRNAQMSKKRLEAVLASTHVSLKVDPPEVDLLESRSGM